MNKTCDQCGNSFEPASQETTCTWCLAAGNNWTCTHTAWFLLCPIYLANIEDDAPVPIPRLNCLGWWLEIQFTLNDCLCWIIGWFAPAAVGFIFYHVHELERPITFHNSSHVEPSKPWPRR